MPLLSPDNDAPQPTQTAIIVPLPAAEPLVAEYRHDLDPAAAWGVGRAGSHHCSVPIGHYLLPASTRQSLGESFESYR